MFPVGARPLQIAVVGGNRVVEALTGWEDDASIDFAIDAVEPTAGGIDTERVDCVVADGGCSTIDVVDAASRWGDESESVAVVVLADTWTTDRVTEALAVGADEAMPRELIDTDPDLVGERIATAVTSAGDPRGIRTLFDTINDGVCLHDPWAENLLDVNERMVELTGYDRETLLDRGVSWLSVEADGYTRESAYELQRRVATTGEPETVEWGIETADGGDRLLEATITPATAAGADRVFVVSRDVTERRELEVTYRNLFENVSDGLVVHHPETGEIRDVNSRFCEMNGYDREDLIGETIDVVTAPEFAYERTQEQIEMAREEGPQLFEWRNQRADGETFPVEVHLSVVEIRGEERILGSVRDITERKRREREYAQIFDGVNSPITVNDPETGEIVDANRAMCDLLGYSREEILDRNVDGVSVTDEGYTMSEARAVVERVMDSGETEPVEWKVETADGEHRWLEIEGTTAEIGGEERYLGLGRDVTEHRRTEQRLRAILDRIDEAVYLTPVEELPADSQPPEYLSSGYEEIWGQSLDQLRETYENGFFDTLHPDDKGDYRAFVERIVDDVKSDTASDRYTVEYRIRRPDGGIRWVHSEYYPLEWDRGPPRVVIVSRDVTERKRTERNLRVIARRVDEAIYMSSPDKTEVYYASPSFEELWDIPTERIYENPQAFIERVHPDDREWFREEYERIRTDLTDPDREPQDTYELEYRVRHEDGEVRWISVRGYPVFDDRGDVDRWIAVNRDVTDRKERERRVASFEEATDDLVTADSPAEATETAVTAGSETLELPAIGAFLYDGEDGVLRPESLAGPLLAEAGLDAVGPDDGPLWDAFATGEPVTSARTGTDARSVVSESTSGIPEYLDAWRVLTLGNHGVLLVGTAEQSLDSESVQGAHILAATLEAALNHLRGQKRLAAQEEQLRTQTERAERLDRIARLTQQVEAAITDASSRTEVETAVCERLVDAGPYDLAWIGGVEVGSDRLTARAVVGTGEQYVAAMDLTTTDGVADPHPAVAAWRNEAVRVVNSLVDEGLSGNWRQNALSAGYQSLCAVPLMHEGIVHGVLTIGTDTPQAFADRERDVLGQLGRTIANALSAIERRRALESDETVELEFRGPGDALPFARVATAADCTVRLERTAAREDGAVSVYFSFAGGIPDDAPELARRSLPGSVDVVTETGPLVVEMRTDEWFGAPLAAYGGRLREARAGAGETVIRVEVPTQTDVRSFVERMGDIAPSLELVAKRQHRKRQQTPMELSDQVRAELTDRQLEVLRTALSAGYFEWPRDHDGSEVAERLGITQPTFNKHLRIAERETFGLLFGDE
ncbi:PAS domain S-box protein [Halobellus ordinarius]|uniref:PAS domain S-box protein n=1 Tax=Halobellus ordinarius TaxID=3075120 RepID=UPI002880A637|nr:PAS domain S-box protein [Halobellus sp. ZY16]